MREVIYTWPDTLSQLIMVVSNEQNQKFDKDCQLLFDRLSSGFVCEVPTHNSQCVSSELKRHGRCSASTVYNVFVWL